MKISINDQYGLHAHGRSKVFDYRYPEHIAYLEELQKFYLTCIAWKPGEKTIEGGLTPCLVNALSKDLRRSMAMLVTALVAGEGGRVKRVDMAMRGYDQLENKLTRLGFIFKISSN